MDNKRKEEMQKIAKMIAQELRARGIDVEGGFALDLSQTERERGLKFTSREEAEKMAKEIFEKIKSSGSSPKRPFSKEERENISNQVKNDMMGSFDEEGCDDETCESCRAFENFEKIVGSEGSIFDYASVKLGDQVFKIKYHENNGHEDLVIQKDLDAISDETLEECLNKAIANKRFHEAQNILNIINQRGK